jgi:hypothetical protein
LQNERKNACRAFELSGRFSFSQSQAEGRHPQKAIGEDHGESENQMDGLGAWPHAEFMEQEAR